MRLSILWTPLVNVIPSLSQLSFLKKNMNLFIWTFPFIFNSTALLSGCFHFHYITETDLTKVPNKLLIVISYGLFWQKFLLAPPLKCDVSSHHYC